MSVAFMCKERWLNAWGTYVILAPRIYHTCGTCLLIKRWKGWLEQSHKAFVSLKLGFSLVLMFALLWASVCQVIRIIANVAFAIMIDSSRNGCWWFDITFGFVILIFTWGFAQVRMFVRCRRRVTILKTTVVVRMIFMRSSLFARGSSAMLAKRNLSFIFFIAGFTVRSWFEIRSVCSLALFVRTIRSAFLPIRRSQFFS